VRLAKMLRQAGGGRSRLAEFLHTLIDQAIEAVHAEWAKKAAENPTENLPSF
jgi:hypothetical protein